MGKERSVAQVAVTAVILLSSLFWSYYLYKPLPDGISNPWKVRFIVSMFKVVEDTAKLIERMGVATKVNTIRAIANMLANIMITDSGGIKVHDTVFNGVRVRVYEPEVHPTDPGPAIIFYHGGGWFFCNVDVHDHMTRSLAQRLGIVLISVEFRLAPENPYPAPLVDCLTATRYVFEHSTKLHIDPRRIAIMGDSSGGNLAASVSLALRDSGSTYQPKIQVLIYPVLQAFDFNLPSFVENDDIVYGSRSSMAEVLLYYMGESSALLPHLVSNNHTTPELHQKYSDHFNRDLLSIRDGNLSKDLTDNLPSFTSDPEILARLQHFILDPLFSPLLAESLINLPETYIMSAQFDVLRDENILYAERLKKAGVKVTRAHYDDAFHGFWAFFNPPLQLDNAERSMNDLTDFLKISL